MKDARRRAPPRRLLVDVSVIAQRDAGTGIQRVVRAIWLQLKSNEGAGLSVIAVAGSRHLGYRSISGDFLCKPLKRLPFPFGSARLRPRAGDVFLGLDLAAHIVPHRKSELLRWKRAGTRLTFFIYDLLPVNHPEWFNRSMQDHFKSWLKFVGHHADLAICISRSVASEFETYVGRDLQMLDPPPTVVISLGASIAASKPSTGHSDNAGEVVTWIRSHPTILMVGTLEPRKGYAQALAAFEQLWSSSVGSSPQLMIVGRPGWKVADLLERLRAHPQNGNKLRWIEDASDEYLETIYEAVDGMLLTSHGEGFGLPLVEAAAHGKPILVRDIPVFREVPLTGAVFFQGEDPTTLATALRHWLERMSPSAIPSGLNDWDTVGKDLLRALQLTSKVEPEVALP